MGDLVSCLSHDIRTSMNGVAGLLALLRDSGLSPAQQQLAADAQHCADDLMALIENLVDLSLIETGGGFALAQDCFDLRELLQAACASPRIAARGKGLALQLHLPPVLTLRGDAARLRQIVGNLLHAAIASAAQGRIAVDASATKLRDDHCRVCVTIRSPEPAAGGRLLSALLNLPEHAEPEAMRAHGRTALALALCKRLARLMDAKVESRSQAGEQILHFSVALACAPGAAAGGACPPQSGTHSLSGRRILVADDNPVNRQVAQRMVRSLGCQVDVASDGAQALAMHAAQPYDLILMDCQMPRMDGYQATERIRALEGARRTPVIAVTAHATQGAREACLSRGMDDFIAKPVRPHRLAEVIARWLPGAAPDAAQGVAPFCSDELDVVRDMFGADFAELARLYQQDSPPRIAALQRAGAAGDYPHMVKVAHALSGSSVSIMRLNGHGC